MENRSLGRIVFQGEKTDNLIPHRRDCRSPFLNLENGEVGIKRTQRPLQPNALAMDEFQIPGRHCGDLSDTCFWANTDQFSLVSADWSGVNIATRLVSDTFYIASSNAPTPE